MPWIQITLCTDRERVPLIEAAMENAGALAVTLGDAADEPQLEPPPGTTPLWSQVTVTALFPDEPGALAAANALSQSVAGQLSAKPLLERIEDQPWERAWLDDFVPARFGSRLWICPRGQPAGDPSAVVVELDPGLAFGTGHHATTALCLRWLDGADVEGKSLLDYGCGSGILAISALRLGASAAVAVDHDPQALETTRGNAERNAVADRLRTCRPGEAPDEQADLVMANILAGPLIELAPRLAALVRLKGAIALSGILRDQTAQVENAYALWFDLDAPLTEDEWVLLSGRRNDAAQPPSELRPTG
jgi:ribosomal protein L11 methyltransferase